MQSISPSRAVSKGEIGLAILAGIAAAVVAFVISTRLPSTFEGRATMLVGSASGEYTDLLAAQILTQTYAQLVVTEPVLEAALQDAGLAGQTEALELSVRGVPNRDSLTVSIVAEANDADAAATVANAIAAELARVGPSGDPTLDDARETVRAGMETMASEIAAARAEIATLAAIKDRSSAQDDRLDRLRERLPNLLVSQSSLAREASQLGADMVRVIDPARSDTEPVSPNAPLNTILAFVTALATVIGLAAFARAYSGPGAAPGPTAVERPARRRRPASPLAEPLPDSVVDGN